MINKKDQVTLDQVYSIVNRLEDKIDHSLEIMAKKTAEMENNINRNTNSLNNLQGRILGATSIISIAVVVVVEYFKGLMSK